MNPGDRITQPGFVDEYHFHHSPKANVLTMMGVDPDPISIWKTFS